MMRFLPGNVVANSTGSGRTHSEGSVSFLPCKSSIEILLNPDTRILLHISHHVGNAMHRPQTGKHVNVIFHTSNNLSDPIRSSYDSSEVRM